MAKFFLAISLDSPKGGFCTSTPWDLSSWDTSTRTQPWRKVFSSSRGGLLQHGGSQCDSLWASLHVRLALGSLDSSCVFGALGRSPSTTGGGFVSLQVRGSFKFKIRGFSTSVDYLDYLGVLSRTLGLRIGGYLPWLRHQKGFILVRGSFRFLGWKPTCLLPCSRMLFS